MDWAVSVIKLRYVVNRTDKYVEYGVQDWQNRG